MTDRFASYTIAIILCVLFWTIVARFVMFDSQQICEQTMSADSCAWELR